MDNKFLSGVFAHKFKFTNGGSIIKMAIKPEQLIEWLQSAPKKGDYVKVQIQEYKDKRIDDYGNVKLICCLDDYQYKAIDVVSNSSAKPAPISQHTPVQQAMPLSTPIDDLDENGEELPF